MKNLQISDRINRLSESQTILMNQKSKELQDKGVDVVNLTLGEPDFNTPVHIKDAAKEAINNNFTKYPPVPGYPSLKKAICDKLKRDNGLDYDPAQIVVSNGAKHSLANVLQCVINAGDEVIVPAPYWVSYIDLIKLSEGTPVIIESSVDTDFKITPEQLDKAITPKTRAVMFNSPSNPSGSVYTKDEVRALAEVLKSHPQIVVISDEIYEKINYMGGHAGFAEVDFLKDQTVLINGVSKAYAMTGWRMGYIAAPLNIAKATNKLQGQFTSGVCAIAQKAAEAAIGGDQECVEEMRQAFLKRRDMVLDMVSDIPGFKVSKPEGAFYIFPDLSYYFGKSYNGKVMEGSGDLCLYLLEVGHVASVPGVAFGDDRCIRFSYAASEEQLRKAFDRIRKALAELK